MNSEHFISWIGLVAIAYFGIRLIFTLLRYAKGFLLGSTVDLTSFGRYACVTGGTDGIGKAYAVELASRGFDLIIISRSPDRLDDLASSIRNSYNVNVHTITADFTKHNIYSSLASELADFDIGILVNNVGMTGTGDDGPRFFVEYDVERIEQMLNCNILSAMMMTRIVLPKLLEKSKGLIVNVSSTAANLPPCLSSVYSSTKLAMQVFSSSLQQETSATSSNIYVQDVAPCFVATKLANQQEIRFHIPNPTDYVRSAMKTIGHLEMTAGCICHQIEVALMSLVPRWLFSRVVFHFQKQRRELSLKKAQ